MATMAAKNPATIPIRLIVRRLAIIVTFPRIITAESTPAWPVLRFVESPQFAFTIDAVCIGVYKYIYDQQRDYQAT